MSRLLTLREAADRVGLRSSEGFARLARRTGIPLIRLSARSVRVDPADLDRAIALRRELSQEAGPHAPSPRRGGRRSRPDGCSA